MLLSIHSSYLTVRQNALKVFQCWSQQKLLPVNHIVSLLVEPLSSVADFQSCVWKLCRELLDQSPEIILTSSQAHETGTFSSVQYLATTVSTIFGALYQVCDAPKRAFMLDYLTSLCVKMSAADVKGGLIRAARTLPPLGQALVSEGGTPPIKCRVGPNKLQVWVPSPTAASSSSSTPVSSPRAHKDTSVSFGGAEVGNGNGSTSNLAISIASHLKYPTTATALRCLVASSALDLLVQSNSIHCIPETRIDKLVQLRLEEMWLNPDCPLPPPMVLHR